MRSRVHETGPPRAAVSVVVGVGVIQNLRRAREAYERREWVSVHQALSGLSDIELEPDDFVALATAAFLLGRTNDVVQALQDRFDDLRCIWREGLTAARRAA
jgi:hypothetical protein